MTVFRWLVKQGLMIPVTVELRAPKPALTEVLTIQEAAAMLANWMVPSWFWWKPFTEAAC